MIPLARQSALAAVAAASALLLAACSALETDARPSPSITTSSPPVAASSPAPTPAMPEDLGIPEPADGELARVVYLQAGPDGVPTSPSEILGAPASADAVYVLEAGCVPLTAPVMVGYVITTADDEQREVSSGTFTCDGTAVGNSGPLGTVVPVQIAFTSTDGVWQAYARLVPAD